MSSPVWMRRHWCWSGILHGRLVVVMTWSTTSSAKVAEVAEGAAHVVGTMCSSFHDSWDSQRAGSLLVTCWPTPSTLSKSRLSTECQTRALIRPNMHQSTSLLTRLVSLHFYSFFLSFFPFVTTRSCHVGCSFKFNFSFLLTCLNRSWNRSWWFILFCFILFNFLFHFIYFLFHYSC